jgi:cytochrome bd ubiquinol oxidase subunit I
MDPPILARIQFATNITFHILFPTITIALGWILFFFKIKYTKTQNQKWLNAYKFWVKIFALCFALGVVSGITMSFQFGTNWPGYMNTVGNIAGPLLAFEVLSAFFLEATFLGVMLFGFKHISNRFHNVATFLVAFGTTLSAFWILVLNSWMQTPAGFEMIGGQAFVTNWWQVIFNPSMPYRITHMLFASGLTAAFLVAGVSAYRWLKNDRSESVLAALKTGVYLAAFLIPLQIFVGDLHGLNTIKHQPAKIAAMEGIWQTQTSVPALIFAVPDEKNKTNHFEIGIPKLASIILTHDPDGEIKGLNEFEGLHPPVAPVFYAFRIMIMVGFLMLAVSWFSAFIIYRKSQPGNFSAKLLVLMTFSGWVALIAGWYATEIGRQPYLVYGILKTADAASSSLVVSSSMITTTLIMYLATYVFLIIAFISVLFHLANKAKN